MNMSIPADFTYYPRPKLTAAILVAAQSFLTGGVTMFAPRRQGKTWFATRELVPAFDALGWDSLYIDLWRRRANPEEGLVELLEEAVPTSRIGRFFEPVDKVTVKANVAGTGGEVGVTKGAGKTVSLEKRLEVALAALMKGGRQRVLVLDEFQTLAGTKRLEFVSALRAVLQKYRGHLFVVFTGSSRSALMSMFKSANAPLFQSATPIPFPTLGRDFIEDRVRLLQERSPRLRLDVDRLFVLFERFGHSPLFANEMILQALVLNSSDLDLIEREWLIAKSEGEDFAGVLAALKPIQRATLQVLARWPSSDGTLKPGMFSEAMRDAIQGAVPEEKVTTARLQTAIKTLMHAQLVASESEAGDYEIEDASFKAYLQAKAKR